MIRELELNEKQMQIKRWVDRLDQVAIAKEAVWGIGRLQKLISAELRIKWDAQNQRLREAIESGNLDYVADIVEGTIRGWDVLEAEAIKNGHKPHDNEYWETTFEGSEFVYRIYKTQTECRAAIQEDGVVAYALPEIARILNDYQLVNKVKEAVGGNLASIDHDKTKKYTLEDDYIPF